MKLRKPCSDCPWRKDATPGYWDPQHFEDIWQSCQDDGLSTMLCHKAAARPPEERASLPCQGWARVMGFDAIGVRLAVMRGNLTCEEVEDRDTAPLYSSFGDMLEANGITPGPRNLRVPSGGARC